MRVEDGVNLREDQSECLLIQKNRRSSGQGFGY